MTDANTGKRPYIRLTGGLRNMSRPIGGEVRMRCEATGSPLPLQFTWLKNLAPLEKSRRFRLKNKEMTSKLVIVELDVLDSGYYQCSASNAAGSVNSTAVLRVSQQPISTFSLNKKRPPLTTDEGGRRGHHRHHLKQKQQLEEDLGEDEENNDYEGFYDNYPDDEMNVNNNNDHHHSHPDNSWRVPNTAAGPGYVPLRRGTDSDGRWLDGQTIRKGDCIVYRGEACSSFLEGKHVKVLVDRESIYDAEKDLLAALMTVRVVPGISEQCKHYMHQTACYHMFKICEPSINSLGSLPSGSDIVSLCREDCDNLKNSVCPNEFSMASHHELIGDGPKALLPNCESLPLSAQNCLHIFEGIKSPSTPNNPSPASHWCFKGFGTKYQGTAAITRSNRPCIDWPNSVNGEFNTGVHPELRNAKNYCRNPSRHSQFSEPWCYTFSPGGQSLLAEPCNVPRCPPNIYKELDDSPLIGTTTTNNNIFDSFSSFWHSLSTQSQLLAFTTALGALLVFLFLFFICCVCCCKNTRRSRRRRRKYAKNSGGEGEGLGGGGGERGEVCVGQCLQQPESASSMLSGSLAQQQKLAAIQHQQNILLHNCNGINPQGLVGGGGGSAGGGGGGSTTLSGSDMNSAFYRKVRDERMRQGGGGGCCNEELLNPLLSEQYHVASGGYQQQQQQLFEMPQQQQFRYWENSGTLNSAVAYPQHGSYYAPQSIKSQQPYNNSPHTEPPPAEPYQIAHIQERQIKFLDRILGEDASTQLILGEWVGGMLSGAALQVVLKTLKSNIPQHVAEEQFKEEIQAIGFFEHPNILRLFGVSFLGGRNLCAVFDYMVHGDLIEFLKVREPRGENEQDEQEERQRNVQDFLKISTQITCGMAYLASNGFVHKDLSARNCLVGDQQIIKICNFARMKSQYERDYYRLNSSCRGVPLRWMSKEALNEGRYGQASDVYSFGVCLWEIYTYGRQPYEGCTDEQVIQFVQEGSYLAIPEFCPPAVYAQMVECFNENASRRPTFAELNSKFQKWCQSNQTSALHIQQHRATSSVNSGGSGSGITTSNIGGPTNGYLSNRNLRQGGGYSSVGGGINVPSPAPNNCSNILAGNFVVENGNVNKNGGCCSNNNIVHSTPIAQHANNNNNNQIEDNNIKKKNLKPIPMARRRQAFTDEDDLDEEEDDDYSSEESNGS
ncbi:unnamed protein product [Meloidogyne enterolobii]|uniref:Uncharacterized protein n=1 Tax=Meloidogyne enterolobii TaxID=390850 RepID=A0ACB1APW4_MELEN